jgi:hypothetical protein
VITKKQGQPITASRSEYSRKSPFVPNAKDTSSDEERMIAEAPQPFKNRNTAAQIPVAPSHPNFKVGKDFARQGNIYGAYGKSVSVKSRPTVNLAAVGEPRAPKGYNSINSGFPLSAKRIVGNGSQPRASKASGARGSQSIYRTKNWL